MDIRWDNENADCCMGSRGRLGWGGEGLKDEECVVVFEGERDGKKYWVGCQIRD